MRIVVYAEGPAETSGSYGMRPAPGVALHEDELGAAHVLVRRLLVSLDARRFAAVRFDEPLRLHRGGRTPVGSDFLRRSTLRGLLTWAQSHLRPDLAIVLLDQDGDEDRLKTVESHIQGLIPPVISVGVAIREFESWLITDMPSIARYVSRPVDEPPTPESMAPGQAKELFETWVSTQVAATNRRRVRREVAAIVELERLALNSRSFDRFRDKLFEKVQLVP